MVPLGIVGALMAAASRWAMPSNIGVDGGEDGVFFRGGGEERNRERAKTEHVNGGWRQWVASWLVIVAE